VQNKLYFCFPYHGVGGVSLLFLRLAEHLVQHNLADCYLIDYKDGFMAMNSNGVAKLVEYSDSKEIHIPKDAVVIFQSLTPWSIYPRIVFSPETRIFYWNCHPFNLVPTLPGIRRVMQSNKLAARIILSTILYQYKSRMVKLIEILLDKSSLVFMDAVNINITREYLDVQIEKPKFLPIPALSANKLHVHTDFVKSKKLRVSWIGRVVDFKFYILKRALIDFDHLSKNNDYVVEFTIIGTGNYQEQLNNVVDSLDMSVFMIDYLSPTEIDNFLCNKVDLLVAMGTSALEGAKFGVPTILLDYSYRDVAAGYKYEWLYNKTGYILAGEVTNNKILVRNDSLDKRLVELGGRYEVISNRTFGYFEDNHSIKVIAELLVYYVSQSKCQWSDFTSGKLNNKGMFYSVIVEIRRWRAALSG